MKNILYTLKGDEVIFNKDSVFELFLNQDKFRFLHEIHISNPNRKNILLDLVRLDCWNEILELE